MNQQRLLRVAAEVFGERGFHNTSVTDLTDALQISRPTLYSYAKSKEDLLAAVYDQLLEFYSDRFTKFVRSEDTPYQRIEGFFRLQQLAISEHRAAVRLAFRNLNNTASLYRKTLRAWGKRIDQFLLTTIDEGQKSGEFDASISPIVFKNALLALLNNMALWHDAVEGLSADDILQQLMRLTVGPRPATLPLAPAAKTATLPSRSFSLQVGADVAKASATWQAPAQCGGAALQEEALALLRWACARIPGGSTEPPTNFSAQWLRRDPLPTHKRLQLRCTLRAVAATAQARAWHAVLYVPSVDAQPFALFQLAWLDKTAAET